MEEKKAQILIVAGEPSGDLQAQALVKEIVKIAPGIRFSGMGGDLLRQAGAEIYYDIKDFSVLGFFDALKNLPRFFTLRDALLLKIKQTQPDAVILVDFSGFNLRLAAKIKKSIPVIYYISPQVWASRPGRVKAIKKFVYKMLVFFKFEVEFYRGFGFEVDFIGHPLLDIVRPTREKEDFIRHYALRKEKLTIALLPGSRKQEIARILPVMLKAAGIIAKKLPGAQFIIAKTTNLDLETYNKAIRQAKADIELRVVNGKPYDCLNAADFCLVGSGTATLETAIMQKPFLIIYKMGRLNYLLYRPQVKLPYIGMANIVAGKKIIPEFIQSHATPQNVANAALKILQDPETIARMKTDLAQVKSALGEKGAAARAARIVVDYLYKKKTGK